jgi:tRNA threonylcarbamoyladenosine biosynthesis protein TsaB
MRILALDTATEACSVALLSGDELIVRSTQGGLSHAQQVLSMVEAVLAQAQVSLSMLDGIAASIGPGAFTGVRITVAVAQGLAFGAELPVVPVTTLEALAFQVVRRGGTHALACLDARMSEVYWGCFVADSRRGLAASSAAAVGPPESVAVPGAGVYHGIGRGFAAYPALGALPGLAVDPRDAHALPNASEFAALGAMRLSLGEGLDPAELSPLYLRDKVALTEAERAAKAAL